MSGMTKVGQGEKLEDSNIANYGSKEHKDAKLAAAKTEKAWEGCGKKVGIEVWRIEKFQVVAWPKEKYGTFHKGDAYIILNTYVKPDNKDKLLYNVHFWLGESCSQDEQGTAAYKTVELDDLLGDLPVQYREVQDHESEEFLKLWTSPMRLLDGGVDSGFNQVKPTEYKARLLHMKGKKHVRVTEVKLAAESLNDGDVFLLDAGLTIYQWNGSSAGINEKRQANSTIEALKKERNGKPKSVILDGLENDPDFWGFFGGKPDKINAAIPDEDAKVQKCKVLFEVSDKTGSLQMTKVAENDLKRAQLATDEVFILDLGEVVYSWIGKGASKAERANGIKFATDYIKNAGRSLNTPVTRVVEGAEPASFLSNFH